MIDQFDIFAIARGGQLAWQGSAETSEAAEELVRRLAKNLPHGEYIIFNLTSGKKMVVNAGVLDGQSRKDSATS